MWVDRIVDAPQLGGALGRRPRVTMTGRRWALDVAIAVPLTVYAGAAAFSTSSDEYPDPGIGPAILMTIAGVALVLRRVRPTLSFLLSLGPMSACALAFGAFQAGSSLLIGIVAAYSALAYGVSIWVFLGMVLVFASSQALGDGPWGGLSSAPFIIVVLGLSAGGGWLARRLRELSAANAALRRLVESEAAANTAAAVDGERSRIARELHDVLSHSLAVVALQTAAAEHSWSTDPEKSREAVRAARATSLEAIDQLKTLLTVVRDDPTGRSPLPTVDDLPDLASATTAAGFAVTYVVEGVPRPLSAQL